jgi:hypothetical protein
VSGACADGCRAGLALGVLATARGVWQGPTGFQWGFELGYAMLAQSFEDRPSPIVPVGRAAVTGRARDDVRLSGALLGAALGWRTRGRTFVDVGLTLGAWAGSVRDRREGSYPDRAGAILAMSAIDESRAAIAIAAMPRAAVGYSIAPSVAVGAEISAGFFAFPSPPTWDGPAAPVILGNDPRTQDFSTFPPESMVGSIVASVAPRLFLRLDL